jgi:hypothetical protein
VIIVHLQRGPRATYRREFAGRYLRARHPIADRYTVILRDSQTRGASR